jgi:hypothetical protein
MLCLRLEAPHINILPLRHSYRSASGSVCRRMEVTLRPQILSNGWTRLSTLLSGRVPLQMRS